jgi:cyclic beta-1,2-glucan synthetase
MKIKSTLTSLNQGSRRNPLDPPPPRIRAGADAPWHSGELLSLERLTEYARDLAREQKATDRVPAKPLLADAERSSRILEDVYAQLSAAAHRNLPLMPGDEWLLDNYHIVRDTIAEIRVDLPRRFYLELPRLLGGPWAGYPRVYAFACELISHTDRAITTENLEAFTTGYQSVVHLTLGELWAIPAMIRLALIENLAYLAQVMLKSRRDHAFGDEWADRLIATAEASSHQGLNWASELATPKNPRIQVPVELRRIEKQLTPTFFTRLLQRMREASPALEPVLSWTEARLSAEGVNPEDAIRAEFARQAALQISVGNAITSMRAMSATNWAGFVERHSFTESLLNTDPAGVYPRMDFKTRDRYRHAIERFARRSHKSEEQITHLVLDMASSAFSSDPSDARHSHVGYYLISAGQQQLRAASGYRSRLGEILSRVMRAHRTALYLGSIAILTVLAVLLPLALGMSEARAAGLERSGGPPGWLLAIATILALLPASELAVSVVNKVVTMLLPPRTLAKLDFATGIPDDCRTFVVIPTLLQAQEEAVALARHLEILYLANKTPNLYFAILSDFSDAPAEQMPGDEVLVETLSRAIRDLGTRYDEPSRFHVLHRKRQWNPKEGVWMGWERKRGKLKDFNRLLQGSEHSDAVAAFTVRVGDPSAFTAIKYVITLDRDTELPQGSAQLLVGTIAHVLNKAEIDLGTGVVNRGYGILQPRVSTTWESAVASRFSRIFSGHTGVDPYTTAVSDLYQDLFSEGIYIGKGLYDVAAFEQATQDRFPANTLLSHDLLEGAYARAGFASDIELYEDFPSRYNVYATREHRWTRGDWQIAGWLLPRVPSPNGWVRNPLSAINRWKIFDNLRRSLVPPAAVGLLALSWLALPGLHLFWTFGVLAVLAFPFYAHLLTATLAKPIAATWEPHLSTVFEDVRTNLAHFALVATFYAYQAYLMSDAIARTLIRMLVTHNHLLEWVTASEAQQTLGSSLPDFVRRMWQGPLFAAVLAVLITLRDPSRALVAAPLLIAWALSPLVAYWMSKPIVHEVYRPTESEQLVLRRVARKSWRYFEDFVTSEERWLAPDNFQEDPKGELAHRTSPTNLSLLFLSTLSAYDLGYLTLPELAARLDCTLSSMEGLEKYNGHFFNWYDTRTGEPLAPKYVSTVDSGNLAGHLIAVKQGCVRLLDQPLFLDRAMAGLRDVLLIMREELDRVRDNSGYEVDGLQAQLIELEQKLQGLNTGSPPGRATPSSLRSYPPSPPALSALMSTLVSPVVALATDVRRLSGSGFSSNGKTAPANLTTGSWDLSDPNSDRRSATARQTAILDAPISVASLSELVTWTDRLAHGVQALEEELKTLVPWADLLARPHPLLLKDSQPEIAAHWARLSTMPQPILSLRNNLTWCASRMSEVRRLQARIREAGLGDEGSAAIRWLERLRQAVSASWTASEALIKRMRDLSARAERMSSDMQFDFLLDEGRKLFAIGYNVAELRRDSSYYDLLASESRLASYVAIARAEIPQEHWFHLARPLAGRGDNLTLLSWTGTMFEYLMPNLVMKLFDKTLLAQACVGAVRRQQAYGRERGVPWGMSESAFNSLDPALNYNYRAFGVSDLGLKRGLWEDLVVAPYATLLALPIDPREALANLRRLSRLGLEGRYGYYDSIDFTRSRIPPGRVGAVVTTYMVHHVGMGLVAIDNFLHGDPLVEHFHSEPSVRAIELILQERIPSQAPLTQPHPIEADIQRLVRDESPPVTRHYSTPNTDVPRAQLLSNGRYRVMITNSGTGYSRWGKLAVTRWRDDVVRDPFGSFIYLSDAQTGAIWSAASAPLGGEPMDYDVSFSLDKVDFRRRDGDVETHMEVVVSPEDDAEIRHITLTNRGTRRREIDLTSYSEIVLGPQDADEAHPAFSKLFVETEYLDEWGALLASRQPRSASENRNWVGQVVAMSRNTVGTTTFLYSPVPEEYETDRALFLGRGRVPASPQALQRDAHLGCTHGAVLDQVFALRQRVRLAPGTRASVSFVTIAADSRQDALSLIDKYHDPDWAARAVRLALTHTQLELRQLNISVDDAMQYQRLFSRMVYPRRGTRASPETMARNSKGQPGLWAYGITGDLPILLVRIADPQELRLVKKALNAHEYWQSKGFESDLVVLNEYPGGYIQPVQEELEKLVAESHARQSLNKPGGVYVKRADIMPEADRILLNTVARVVLVGSRGNLDLQLSREVSEPPLPPVLRYRRTSPVEALRQNGRVGRQAQTQDRLQMDNGLGGFGPDGREYVVTLEDSEWTPVPWSNVIANPNFGCIVTESGLGSTWSENSRENRITPWSNDPVSDPPAEAIYIRDEETGQFWSPTPLPVRQAGRYTVRHGQGYTLYTHEGQELRQELRVSVAANDPVKICKLILRNNSARPRRLSATYFAELAMGVSRETFARFIVTQDGPSEGAILARNPYNNEFAGRVAFATTDGSNCTLTADRNEFLGRNGHMGDPAALKRRNLSGRTGAGLDPCFALQCQINLKPSEERSINFILGEGENTERAEALLAHYREPQRAEKAFSDTVEMWDRLLSPVEVTTPDEALNLVVNRWLLYQVISCRYWGRSAFYQGGGAYGFRDQLQDVMSLIYTAPEMTPEQILRCAEHQFKEGDVQHWWHPPTGRGVRTRFSDDLLWLPFVTAYYLEATGDTGLLDERRRFLDAPLLQLGQEDMYSMPNVSEEEATVYEHCLRAIHRGSTRGPHGLPLMGSGDWNDGMNRVGIGGKGESVWVGWFLYATLSHFIPICEQRGDGDQAQQFKAEMHRLKKALEASTWDGEWYLRAFFDDGTPLGSSKNQECSIDSIAQSWAVISGAASKDRARQAMKSVEDWLVWERERLMPLLTPPFDKSPHDPGYIMAYPPGIRENGGQYTHAATWTVIASVLMGDGDGAYKLFDMMNPINHTRTHEELARYKVEPYVIVADIYTHPQHIGRGGWSWYTGSASWYYRLAVEYILGLKRHADHLTVEPCLPSHWPGYTMTYRFGKSTYHITVENEEGASGAGRVEMDGSTLRGGKIPLVDDGAEHQVKVVMGDRRPHPQAGTRDDRQPAAGRAHLSEI